MASRSPIAARSRQIAAAFVDQLVDAVRSQPLRLARSGSAGQLVDRDLAGDVLLAEPFERMAAAGVAAVGAEPLRPRSVGHLVGVDA